MILRRTWNQRNGHGECGLAPIPTRRTRSLNKQAWSCFRMPARDARDATVFAASNQRSFQQSFHVACAGRRAARLPRADLPEGERRS